MALSERAVFEIRADATTGNVNGGGFVTTASGVDFSQQTGALTSIQTAVTAGAGVTIPYVDASASLVGNFVNILGGTNFVTGSYWITAAEVGVSLSFDRTVATGVGANGTINIGGAFSTISDAVLELAVSAPTTFANKFYIRSGNYTVSGAVVINALGDGTMNRFHMLKGYTTVRDDACTGDNRPLLNAGVSAFASTAYWRFENLRFMSSSTVAVIGGQENIFHNVKVANVSTAARVGLTPNSNARFFGCEFVAMRGTAVDSPSGSGNQFIGCHFHSSNNGLRLNNIDGTMLRNSLFEACLTAAINNTAAASSLDNLVIDGCTFVGGTTIATGFGFRSGTIARNLNILNSIFYGCQTAVQVVSASANNFDAYNNYFNNSADVVSWVKGTGAMATDPGFINFAMINGTNASTTAGSLTAAGADFSAVVDGQDYVFATGGGLVAGYYQITAHTTTTLSTDPAFLNNASANKTFRIFTGRNYGVGTNMRAQGYPGAYGIPTTSYLDVGAIQRQETAGGASTGSGYSRGRVVNRGSP